MFDVGAIAIAVACFACIAGFLWAMGKV